MITTRPGYKDYPAVCHSAGAKSLIIYSGWTDSINGQYANAMHIWGVFVDDTLGIAGKREDHVGEYHSYLMQNTPNPFSISTRFNYQLSSPSKALLAVYNINGQLVKTIVDECQKEGFHSVQWDGRNQENEIVSSGIYFYRLQAGMFNKTKKLILLK
jgi:hypothetical protein